MKSPIEIASLSVPEQFDYLAGFTEQTLAEYQRAARDVVATIAVLLANQAIQEPVA